jgi:hypothetical protein
MQGGEEMFYIKGQEVNSLGDLPEDSRKEAAHDILTELYKIWCREHGQELESIEVNRKRKGDVGA